MGGRHFLSDEAGAVMVEFTIVITLLMTLVLGFVDLGHAFYQWNAANKSVQVGVRLAAVSSPVAEGLALEALTPASSSAVGTPVASGTYHYTCSANAAGVPSCACTSGSCAGLAASQDAFGLLYFGDDFDDTPFCGAVVAGDRPGMCDFFPGLEPQNVRIEYIATGLGYWTRPGGAVPTIRVSIVGRQFEFFFLGGLLSFADITMPNMLSTITGEDLSTTYTN